MDAGTSMGILIVLVDHQRWCTEHTSMGARQILRKIAGSPALTELNLTKCLMPNDCCSALAQVFNSCPRLRTVHTRWAGDDQLEFGWVDQLYNSRIVGPTGAIANSEADATALPTLSYEASLAAFRQCVGFRRADNGV
jgi:hypothetical protein